MLISDNGPGIPSEERIKIFNKFYQIEGSFTGQVQGMGLGLALVKRVVEEHIALARVLRVESELGLRQAPSSSACRCNKLQYPP